MLNSDTELLFPSRVIPELRLLRNKQWQVLVENISEMDTQELDHLAFVLLMVRLAGCTTCNADSYRAMRGCTLCALQIIRRYKGSDDELFELYSLARQEVADYLNSD